MGIGVPVQEDIRVTEIAAPARNVHAAQLKVGWIRNDDIHHKMGIGRHILEYAGNTEIGLSGYIQRPAHRIVIPEILHRRPF